MVKVTSLLINAGSGPGFNFGVRAWKEMEIWCVKGMLQRGHRHFKSGEATANKRSLVHVHGRGGGLQ